MLTERVSAILATIVEHVFDLSGGFLSSESISDVRGEESHLIFQL